MKVKAKKKFVPLQDCPVGLFLSEGELCVKTQYHLESYIVSSGERFWGGTTNKNDLANVQVKPCYISEKKKRKKKVNAMKLFSWEAMFTGDVIAAGYLLAADSKEAERKLQSIPLAHESCVTVKLNTYDCGEDGCEFDKNGIAVRWEET